VWSTAAVDRPNRCKTGKPRIGRPRPTRAATRGHRPAYDKGVSDRRFDDTPIVGPVLTGSRQDILVHAEEVLRVVLCFHRGETFVVVAVGRLYAPL
jgi:hypothetical protein